MTKQSAPVLSVVVPVYNEHAALPSFHVSLVKILESQPSWEIVYVDDGSSDASVELVKSWHQADERVRLVALSRNFGKENALTAGLAVAQGDAIISLDADGQHPVELIADFVTAWQEGNRVVVGVRQNESGSGFAKGVVPKLFYWFMNQISTQKLVPGATDFRLIDKTVRDEFLKLKESDRITRGLIDWLGFQPVYIEFKSKARQHGEPTYSKRMLVRLAMNSIVSLTPWPLYLFGYLGIFITITSFLLGSVVFIEQLLLEDPLSWNFTGTAMLGILLLFLVGVVLMSQGILSLYLSHIHNQSKQRPLYVVDSQRSAGIIDRA